MELSEIKKTMRTSRFVKMVARYQFLIANLHTVDISGHADFQRTYNCFFQLRRNVEYRKRHFDFMQKHKANTSITFGEVLEFLSSIAGTVEASFASKMLSIIDPEMPVLDSKVLQKLGLKKRTGCDQAEAVRIYDRICDWYSGFMGTKECAEWIDLFNRHFPNSGISNVKKIDFVLWQMD